ECTHPDSLSEKSRAQSCQDDSAGCATFASCPETGRFRRQPMPGLDHSDVIAFMRVIDAPASDIAVRAAGFIETVQDKLKGYEAHIAAAPEDRREIEWALNERPIKRCEELLVRLKSADPWAYWPLLPDEYLHASAAWAARGYWQGVRV